MTLPQIVRDILAASVDTSLDVAGPLVVDGAWPFLKGPLGPVLDRLKERIRGKDITSSAELARQAADAFEADQHLQEILRSALIEQFDRLAKGQDQINAGVQQLMVTVSGDQKLLKEISGGIARIEDRQSQPVELSDESIQRLMTAMSHQAESVRRVRDIALRATGPVADLLGRQLQRLQIRAVELVREGEPDRALDELQEGQQLVAALLNEAPSDLTARLQLGFIFKTFAQVATDMDRPEDAADYLHRAEEVFRSVSDDVAGDEGTAFELGTAIHGLGNAAQEREDFDGAISLYQEANALAPGNPYILHDMVTAYYQLGVQGRPHLVEMRHALEDLKRSGTTGLAGLGARHMADLEAVVAGLEASAAQGSGGPIATTAH